MILTNIIVNCNRQDWTMLLIKQIDMEEDGNDPVPLFRQRQCARPLSDGDVLRQINNLKETENYIVKFY